MAVGLKGIFLIFFRDEKTMRTGSHQETGELKVRGASSLEQADVWLKGNGLGFGIEVLDQPKGLCITFF